MPISKLPKVQLTNLLRNKLLEFDDPDFFANYFAEWKAAFPHSEFTDPYFGKDSYYKRPTRLNGEFVLWHVHLEPNILQSEIDEWNKQLKFKARKTSNTALVYAKHATHGFLLIDIFWEPDGHDLSEMKTQKSIDMMEEYADVAEHFLLHGKSLI